MLADNFVILLSIKLIKSITLSKFKNSLQLTV